MNVADQTSLWWIRRDLRITDNCAFHAAAESDYIIPFYCFPNPTKNHRWTGAKRQQFLLECLESLNNNLRTLNTEIIFRTGEVIEELERLFHHTPFSQLHFSMAPDPHGKATEQAVELFCKKHHIQAYGHLDHAISLPTDVYNKQGNVYRVFTPYSKMWLATSFDQSLSKLSKKQLHTPRSLDGNNENMPTLAHWGHEDVTLSIEAGEKAARERMKQALSNTLPLYGEQRNIPAGQTTSRLSQDLRFGLISIRELVNRTQNYITETTDQAAQGSAKTYLSELIWREFYFQILHHFPHVLDQSFNPVFDELEWPGTEEALERWKTGTTGFPIIDAGMRELNTTGFMHNRVRMITAMFLTKDLHCHWKAGESYFMQQLLDGEIASNNGGWQWSAGTGADAAPYFRIQNPWTQSKRFDPEATYIKQWIPDLQHVPAKRLHECPKGLKLANPYPLPMLDHATERDRTLALFAACKEKHQA